MTLQGKVAMVTGGAGGIGRAIGYCLAAAGAKVALTDLDGDGARAAASSLDTEAIGLEVDAADVDASVAAVDTVEKELGHLDIVVNNAGISRPDTGFGEMTADASILGLSQEEWDEQLRNNLRSAFATSKAAVPRMTDGGSLVNVASVAGLRPAVELPAYGAAKAGVVHLTRTLALQLAARRIRVNAICPGLVWTRAWELLGARFKQLDPAFADATPRQVFEAIVARTIPLQREQTAEDIGNLVVFLSSDLAANITGQVIAVDGGLTQGAPRESAAN